MIHNPRADNAVAVSIAISIILVVTIGISKNSFAIPFFPFRALYAVSLSSHISKKRGRNPSISVILRLKTLMRVFFIPKKLLIVFSKLPSESRNSDIVVTEKRSAPAEKEINIPIANNSPCIKPEKFMVKKNVSEVLKSMERKSITKSAIIKIVLLPLNNSQGRIFAEIDAKTIIENAIRLPKKEKKGVMEMVKRKRSFIAAGNL